MPNYSSLRRHPCNVSSRSTLSYSSNGTVYIEKLNLRTSPSSTECIEALCYLVAHARVSYSEALSVVGSRLNRRALLIADISVPLQALRTWAMQDSAENDSSTRIGIGHVFSQEHLYIIARILALVYEQERVAHLHYSVLLSLRELFGQSLNHHSHSRYSLHVLHRMYKMARDNLGHVHRKKYLEHTHKDDEVERLQNLSQGKSNLFHVLPLHPDGLLHEGEEERSLALIQGEDFFDESWSYKKIAPFDPFPHDSMVYLGGNCEIVEVTLVDSKITTRTRLLPDSFRDAFGKLRRRGKTEWVQSAEAEEEEDVEGLEKVIKDANAGNIWAASYLLSQTLQRRVLDVPEIPSGLKLGVVTNLLGVFYSYDGEYIIPAVVEGKQWPTIFWDSGTGCYKLSWRISTEDGEVWSARVDVDGGPLIQ